MAEKDKKNDKAKSEMTEKLNDLLAQAGGVFLPDEIRKLGEKAITKGLEREGLPISKDALKGFRAGLTMSLSVPEDGDASKLRVMILMLVSKLIDDK